MFNFHVINNFQNSKMTFHRKTKIQLFCVMMTMLLLLTQMTEAQRRGGGGKRRKQGNRSKSGRGGINMYKSKASKEYYNHANVSIIIKWIPPSQKELTPYKI